MIASNAKEDIFFQYSEYILTSGKSFRLKTEFLRHVQSYINSTSEYNKRTYKDFINSHLTDRLYDNHQKEAILDFLTFIGVGFRKKSIKKVKPLEKLETINDKNKIQINKYLDWLQTENDYSDNTAKSYIYTIKDFFKYSNEFSLEQSKRYIRSLEEQKFNPKTLCLRITGLEKYAEYLGKPIKMKRPKIPRKLQTDNIPTEEEYTRLLEYLKTKKNQDHYYWLKVLATTGARASEFLQLQWEDIISGEVTLKGKGSKYRRFFFNKNLQSEVKKYISETGRTGHLAIGRFGPITSRGLYINMQEWGRKCGIDKSKMHPHAFRHFFAKMYLKKNKDVVQLAELLGHGSIDTTRIYLQKSYDEQKREFNRSVTW